MSKQRRSGLVVFNPIIEEEHPSIQKEKGLRHRHKPSKVEFILRIEKKWEAYAKSKYGIDKKPPEQRLHSLLKDVQFTIQAKAKVYSKKWAYRAILEDEFESVFWETAWRLCDGDIEQGTDDGAYQPHGNFYFFETLILSLDRRATDLIRHRTKTKKAKFEIEETCPLWSKASEFISSGEDIEKNVTDRISINKLLDESSKQETHLVTFLYSYPDASNSEIATHLGLSHRESARRMLKRIRNKAI
ncbi:sigma-70 family RNA polymerase sigma factor [Thermoactinomyces sp. DSM 45892]|uniref:sigma-70 family RNA polymerase sigma factor n=1 Tax=Thermoactinomyces sp. DSM 45892 TaxID=1882753 RepID=UPI00089C8E2A|nr:sigma-70 family RNA polymerase sigma factor [Thermoactinomyces sp. DSM 45892]SDZ25159.1 hypothetical protein SAMN05444416_11784 [Thermoactinomyces sp. DSM 45892]